MSPPSNPETRQPSNHDPYAPLRYSNFRRLVLAHGTSTVAREAQIVVVAWQIYEITRDPLSLGLIGLAEALPFVGVALVAGHVADRANRRTIWGVNSRYDASTTLRSDGVMARKAHFPP